jgi:hypothetical protein
MSRFTASFGRYVAVAFLISLLSAPAFSQVALREALDFDNDQKADFAIFRPSQNVWYVLGSSGAFKIQQWGLASEDRLVPGDYDGDNVADFAVWRDNSGLWFVLNSATSTFSTVQWGANGDEPVGRDYDGDGRTDRAIVRRSGGQMYWWINGTTAGPYVLQFGLDSDFVAPGDYDGDGRFDLAIQRPGSTPTSQATFYMFNSTEGFRVVSWGWGSDYIAPGDYDGDGRTDLAVVREGATATSNLIWFILRSDGNGFLVEAFGLTGDDYIAQGDYNGDGKTEMAVWRQSLGLFYVLKLPERTLSGAYWGSPGDLPVASYDTH